MPDETRLNKIGMRTAAQRAAGTALDFQTPAKIALLVPSPWYRGKVGPRHEAQITRCEVDGCNRGSLRRERREKVRPAISSDRDTGKCRERPTSRLHPDLGPSNDASQRCFRYHLSGMSQEALPHF